MKFDGWVWQKSDLKNLFKNHMESQLDNQVGENVLSFIHKDYQGMVYFLTGNCHIEWEE